MSEYETYVYCRTGIPGEGFDSDFIMCTKYAMQEAQGLTGEERKRQLEDMFLVTPDGAIRVPGPQAYEDNGWEWVPAPATFRQGLLDTCWTEEWLRAVRVQ